jgi:integrase
MLGVVLGLRACDVKALRLTDIDWRRGEICIVQHKTGKPLALPLTTDVGEALKDYILHARPSLLILIFSFGIKHYRSNKIQQ